MALYIYQPGIQPLGQFDGYDTILATVRGGEIGTVMGLPRVNSAAEKAAYDVLDGYTNVVDLQRVGITTRIANDAVRPLWLVDEGTTGYGTLFGQVIGTPVGLSTTGTNLGPHTAAASGKLTCWDKPGLYAISVDAVDTSVDGFVLTNALCDPGVAVSPQTDGVLTLRSSGTALTVNVGRFLEFETRPFLVTTPASLVTGVEAALRVVISYNVE
jgi:hypothetical protein